MDRRKKETFDSSQNLIRTPSDDFKLPKSFRGAGDLVALSEFLEKKTRNSLKKL